MPDGVPDSRALVAPENPLDKLRTLQFIDRRENVVLLTRAGDSGD
jgi:hypothetical protein